jgi:hypothetical protein
LLSSSGSKGDRRIGRFTFNDELELAVAGALS